jgi:CheY-like chemotaxis protein
LVAVNLNTLVEEIYNLLRRTFPPEIKIKLIFDSDLLPIKANPSQMSQMIMNLCVNARDAIMSKVSETGEERVEEICLRTTNVELSAAQASRHINAKPGKHVRITVTDTGKGMSGEVMKRLFEPFFTTKGEKSGTGLGLAVVYGIVQHHDGFIDVRSTEGEGSTFEVFLPVSKEMRSEKTTDSIEGSLTAGKGTMLVVEDEPQVRKMIRLTLEKSGYTVVSAANGIEAVSKFRTHQNDIDLVILDMVMPEMGGQQCFHELKGMNPDVKIVIMTGYTADGSADDFVRDGALQIIEKPFELREFTKIVQRAIQ